MLPCFLQKGDPSHGGPGPALLSASVKVRLSEGVLEVSWNVSNLAEERQMEPKPNTGRLLKFGRGFSSPGSLLSWLLPLVPW